MARRKLPIQQAALDYLNDLLVADPATMNALIEFRVPCNENLANDPDCVTQGVNGDDDNPDSEVGLLGVINGLLTTLGSTRIAAVFSDGDGDGQVARITGFIPYPVETTINAHKLHQCTVKEFLATNPKPGTLVSFQGYGCSFVRLDGVQLVFKLVTGGDILRNVDEFETYSIPFYRIVESGK